MIGWFRTLLIFRCKARVMTIGFFMLTIRFTHPIKLIQMWTQTGFLCDMIATIRTYFALCWEPTVYSINYALCLFSCGYIISPLWIHVLFYKYSELLHYQMRSIVPEAGIKDGVNYIPQYLCGVITCPCAWYLTYSWPLLGVQNSC